MSPSKTKTTKSAALTGTIRPPVIVVMGHIDHGKSTLLDFIRQSNVVATEAGGITQAVSAYEVTVNATGNPPAGGQKITFIDTPGHAAFCDMRQRGACLADIAILIVSAEEGVKPQTIEALKVIQAQRLPFVVAINKIDRPNANPELVKQQLAEQSVLVEGYGGTIPWVAISAKTGTGVPELLELLLLTAALAELTGDPSAPAQGWVLEAQLDNRSGQSAVLIIKNGTLRLGDYLVIGSQLSKIKNLRDFRGHSVQALSFSAPALVIGLSALPPVGATFQTYTDKVAAENAAKEISPELPVNRLAESGHSDESKIIIPIFLKADVTGSLEAIQRELAKVATTAVSLKVLASGVGTISENDVKLASASTHSLLLGFQVKVAKTAADLATSLGVEIKTFDIIYKLTEWLTGVVADRTPKQQVLETIGRAKILKTFSSTKNKQVIGGQVLEGKLSEGKMVKILRRETEIGQGKILELQQQKSRLKEVVADNQFGAMVEAKIVIAAGDQLLAYDLITK